MNNKQAWTEAPKIITLSISATLGGTFGNDEEGTGGGGHTGSGWHDHDTAHNTVTNSDPDKDHRELHTGHAEWLSNS